MTEPRCDFDCSSCREHTDWADFHDALETLARLAVPLWNFGDGRGGSVCVEINAALSRAAAEAGKSMPSGKIKPLTVADTLGGRDGWNCTYCAKPLQPTLPPPEVDHVIPKSKGGSDELSNLVLACGPCNSSKGSKLLEDWKR